MTRSQLTSVVDGLRVSGIQPKSPDTRPRSVSVIVPVRRGAPEPCTLSAVAYSCERLEVILVWGECPSRQRNEAARRAIGDLLLFLDDDSVPSHGLIEVYLEAFARDPHAAAIGGPAVYSATGFQERLSTAVLSDPWVTGRSAARYSARGDSRQSNELELILANLAVRRSAFVAAGGFEETLYPNEENLLLDRLRERGEEVRYEPGAVVTRPAPRAGVELLGKCFRYGRGRAAQARRSLSASSALRVSAPLIALLSILAVLMALIWTPLPSFVLASLLVPYQVAIAVRISKRGGLALGLVSPVVASGVHLAYAIGILSGLLRLVRTRGNEVVVQQRILSGWHLPKTLASIRGKRLSYVHEEDHQP